MRKKKPIEYMVAGGRPGKSKEVFLIKDSEGYIASTKEYIDGNPNLFAYCNTVKINSTTSHIFIFTGG